MIVSVCIDTKGYSEKPSDSEVPGISKRIASYEQEVTLTECMRQVVFEGRTFTQATFTGSRKRNEDFKQMQLFVVDVDNDREPYITYREFNKKCMDLGLPISAAYYSFNSIIKNGRERFRVIFCHAAPIENVLVAKMILEMLKGIFPEADRNCFEPSRMFFGGRELIELNDDIGHVFKLSDLTLKFQETMFLTQGSNFRRKISSFAGKYGVGLKEGHLMVFETRCAYGNSTNNIQPVKNDENSLNPLLYSIDLREFSSKIVIYGESVEKIGNDTYMRRPHSKRHKPIQNVGVKELCEVCRLFSDFVSGEYMDHGRKFLLATNLAEIEGMKKVFLGTIRKFHDHYDKWRYEWGYNISNNYSPMLCKRGCHYEKECPHAENIVNTLRKRRKCIKKYGTEKYVVINEGYEAVCQNIDEAVRSGDDGVIIVHAQTGLGKSHACIEYMRNDSSRKYILAEPLVALKNEIYERNKDIMTCLPSDQDLGLPVDIQDTVKMLYDRGLMKEAREVIREYAETIPEEEIHRKKKFEAYLNREGLIGEEEKRIIIMTHTQLLFFQRELMKEYTVIIDEDILYTIFRNTKEISSNDVQRAIEAGILPNNKEKELRALLSDDT